MAVNKKRKKIDRISQLPDCLLHHIFSFAFSIDVVRTCVLSKRWRYLWTSCPYLNFNFDYFCDKTNKYCINFVNQLLLRRNSIPITSFVYTNFEVEGSVVESWIHYAVNHQVQRLTLEPYCPKISFEFPKCFYGCASLTTLRLDSVDHFDKASILLPKTLELPSLKNLHLINFSDFDGSIFSSIPNLETLKLEKTCFDGIKNFSVSALNLNSFYIKNQQDYLFDSHCEFVIVAPKLRKFKFDGDPPFVSSTKNLCSLDQIEIDPYCELDTMYTADELQKCARKMFQMLNAFHIAKAITISMTVIQVLSSIPSLLNEYPSQFPNLKSLKVKADKFSKNLKIPNFILDYFLKDSSLLEICWK